MRIGKQTLQLKKKVAKKNRELVSKFLLIIINGYVHGFTPCYDDDVILLLAGLAKTSAGMQPSKSLTKREKKRMRSKKNGERGKSAFCS